MQEENLAKDPTEAERAFTKEAMTNVVLLLKGGLYFGKDCNYVAASINFLEQVISKIEVTPTLKTDLAVVPDEKKEENGGESKI